MDSQILVNSAPALNIIFPVLLNSICWEHNHGNLIFQCSSRTLKILIDFSLSQPPNQPRRNILLKNRLYITLRQLGSSRLAFKCDFNNRLLTIDDFQCHGVNIFYQYRWRTSIMSIKFLTRYLHL